MCGSDRFDRDNRACDEDEKAATSCSATVLSTPAMTDLLPEYMLASLLISGCQHIYSESNLSLSIRLK
jgi:hypothetical protein